MKPGIVVVIVAAIVATAGIVYAFTRSSTEPVSEAIAAAPPAALSGVIHVDDLAKDPKRFSGDIVLEGVVSGVARSDGVFGVIDAREYAECGELDCTDTVLPVEIKGKLPPLKARVQITGRVVQGKKGLVFKANHLEQLP